MTIQDIRKEAEKRAIDHANYLVNQAGGNVWGFRKMKKMIEDLTERMVADPSLYGIK